ncbi:RNA polymerase sigma factor [Pedobacter sp. SYP-B3415]|uniref:RNA polymerase sigma factor n=1 Tax=Pedobacter sp. SYP-B3415 TaxID=2496641 RepID=UPI00101CEAC3|nr:sigma-70 family RNA polymerase sigma factor [Pedobacter sp. SYP-B3415]
MNRDKELQRAEHERSLWGSMKEGDHDAYTKLIGNYFQLLYSYGVRLERDEELVKDCIQTMFHDIWKNHKNLAQEVSVKPYFFSCLRRLLVKQRREWLRFEKIEDDYCFDVEINIETRLIEDQELKEQKTRIQTVLNNMPARQREILYLRFYEGLNHQKICEVMQINHQVVYNLLHKSLLRFRRDWAALGLLLPLYARLS